MRKGLSIFCLLLLVTSFASAYSHLGNNVYINLNGQNTGLQNEISSGNFAKLYSGGISSGELIFGHNANEIIVNVNGIIKTFSVALSDGSLISASKGSSPAVYAGYNLIHGEYATNVSVSNATTTISLQQAINDGWFYLVSEGTRANPFRIYTCQGLENISNNLIASYILMNNIDCTGFANFKTIGNYLPYTGSISKDSLISFNSFKGEFNGNGFSIINLTISSCKIPCSGLSCSASEDPGSYSGLFGIVSSGGYVHDVHLVNLNNSAQCSVVINHRGGIAGYLLNSAISNCSVSGVVGENHYGAVVGGVVGRVERSNISRSYSSASVYANSETYGELDNVIVGGLVGGVYYFSNVSESYSIGAVTASSTGGTVSVGGLGGYVESGIYLGLTSYWNTVTSGQTTSVFGTGKNTAEMKTQSTFVGWNFNNIWSINSNSNYGYPYLGSGCVPSCVAADGFTCDLSTFTCKPFVECLYSGCHATRSGDSCTPQTYTVDDSFYACARWDGNVCWGALLYVWKGVVVISTSSGGVVLTQIPPAQIYTGSSSNPAYMYYSWGGKTSYKETNTCACFEICRIPGG